MPRNAGYYGRRRIVRPRLPAFAGRTSTAMTHDKEPTMAAQALHDVACHNGSLFRLYRLIAEMALYLAGQLVALQQLARRRMQLAELDAAALKDVGLSRADIRAALKAPRRRR